MVEQNQKDSLQQKINDDMQKAHEKIESLLGELKSLAVILEERVGENRQRFREVNAEIDDLCRILDETKSASQHRIIVLEQRCETVRENIQELWEEVEKLRELKTAAAIQELKLSGQQKVTATIIGLGISIISTVITLIISQLLGG